MADNDNDNNNNDNQEPKRPTIGTRSATRKAGQKPEETKDSKIIRPSDWRREEGSDTIAAFEKILDDAAKRGVGPQQVARSVEWLWSKAQSIGSRATPDDLMLEKSRLRKGIEIGAMYFFVYDAKLKHELPYWDRFPLVFPIGPRAGGFLGINLHYLDYRNRTQLLKEIYKLTVGSRYTERSKAAISYDILNSASSTEAFKPCVKHYLFGHVRSRFLQIYHSEWALASALPVQRFVGASSSTVWSDSKKKMR